MYMSYWLIKFVMSGNMISSPFPFFLSTHLSFHVCSFSLGKDAPFLLQNRNTTSVGSRPPLASDTLRSRTTLSPLFNFLCCFIYAAELWASIRPNSSQIRCVLKRPCMVLIDWLASALIPEFPVSAPYQGSKASKGPICFFLLGIKLKHSRA